MKHQLKTDRHGVNVWPYASAMLDESSQVKSTVLKYGTFADEVKFVILITATLLCINFEERHLKCMPNICIQFSRALLLDLKYC